MFGKIIRFIFFGNYFIGLLALALSFETAIQLRLPLCSLPYYVLLFCGTIMYYSYAYSGVLQSSSSENQRSVWYRENQILVKFSQLLLLLVCLAIGFWLLYNDWNGLLHLPLIYWIIMAVMGLSVILYYGLLPRSLIRLNLRNTGWLKAFVIGFVWAAATSLLPLIMLRVEKGFVYASHVLVIWLFIKNWMFCTVNAIMFDMKDYADDSNQDLRTFVVRFGFRKTILFVLTPLCLIGICSTLVFTQYRHFKALPAFLNILPFLLLLLVTWTMQRQKNIFFYLIIIDGLVLFKAICGIAGMAFVPS
jgi:4-hydroxybenzoate polyprenyltransferase